VHDAERLASLAPRLVRFVQAAERVRDDRADDSDGDGRLARLRLAENARERRAVHVLHDDEELAVLRDDIERLDDVGVPYARHEARLVEEHGEEVRVARERLMEPLDRDRAHEARGAHLPPDVDGRHASRRNGPREAVATSTDRVRHACLAHTAVRRTRNLVPRASHVREFSRNGGGRRNRSTVSSYLPNRLHG
jgi:hypothetical protein